MLLRGRGKQTLTIYRSFGRRTGGNMGLKLPDDEANDMGRSGEEVLKEHEAVQADADNDQIGTQETQNNEDHNVQGSHQAQESEGREKPKVERPNKYAHLGFESNIDQAEMEGLYATKKVITRTQGDEHFYGKNPKRDQRKGQDGSGLRDDRGNREARKGGDRSRVDQGMAPNQKNRKPQRNAEAALEGADELDDETELKQIESVIEERDKRFHTQKTAQKNKEEEFDEDEDDEAFDEDDFGGARAKNQTQRGQNRPTIDRPYQGNQWRGDRQRGDDQRRPQQYQNKDRGPNTGRYGDRDQGYTPNNRGYNSNNRGYTPNNRNYSENNPRREYSATQRYNDRPGGYSEPRNRSFQGNNRNPRTESYERNDNKYSPGNKVHFRGSQDGDQEKTYENRSNRFVKRDFKPELKTNDRVTLNHKSKNQKNNRIDFEDQYAHQRVPQGAPMQRVPNKSWKVREDSYGDNPKSGKEPGKKRSKPQPVGDYDEFEAY